jgi:hypothetical protein
MCSLPAQAISLPATMKSMGWTTPVDSAQARCRGGNGKFAQNPSCWTHDDLPTTQRRIGEITWQVQKTANPAIRIGH